jgi:autotransporter-associated beta strand protein
MRQAAFLRALVVLTFCSTSHRATSTEFTWNPSQTGVQSWFNPANWSPAGSPNSTADVANLSVPLNADLSVNAGGAPIFIAGLRIGGTGPAVNTTITTVGATGFVLSNEGSDENNENGFITVGGSPASLNRIMVPVTIDNDVLEFTSASTGNVSLHGTVDYVGTTTSIRSFLPSGLKATIHHLDLEDPFDANNYRTLRINDSAGSPPEMPTISTQGTLEINQISGYGAVSIGITASQQPLPLGTVILNGPNSFFGEVQLNRANVVLADDSALGYYFFYTGNPNQAVGYNLISDHDDRTIGVPTRISQWVSIKGEHSLTWTGPVGQGNSRGWVNLLPAGKEFRHFGGHYAVSGTDTERTFSFDGSGRTEVFGGLHDKYDFVQGVQVEDGSIGHFRKTGMGTLVVGGVPSSYHGTTIIEAGNWHFNVGGHLANSSAIVSTGGAIGIDDPALPTFSNPALLDKIDADDTGGLMLTPGEAAANLDFTSGLLANAANMSVAAPETGITYTGTITPANDTYRLGGGTGTLTLPNANLLTGARSVVVANGGEVFVDDVNDYAGPTTINSTLFTSRTDQAIVDSSNLASQSMSATTTLTATTITDGGVPSSIGSSSSDAASLMLQGGTLKYVGPATTTDRLFTIGTRGATIDASGTGNIFFENDGLLAVEDGGPAVARTLVLTGTNDAANALTPLINNAADGGLVGVTKTGSGLWRLVSDNSYAGPTNVLGGTLHVMGTQFGGGTYYVGPDGTLGGTGTLAGIVSSDGTVAPGVEVGQLRVFGEYSQNAGATLAIEVAGTGLGDHDRLSVFGPAILDGELAVEFVEGFTPSHGDVVEVLHADDGIFGEFVDFDLPLLAGNLSWNVIYSNFSVLLEATTRLPGDYDYNGSVGPEDYARWKELYGTGHPAADGNGDGIVDAVDYTVWRNHATPGAGAGGLAGGLHFAVPEPAGAALAVLALALTGGGRRFRAVRR